MHPNPIAHPGTDLLCLKSALAKAIFNHPAITEVIAADPELSQLYNFFLEVELQLHYKENGISDNPQPG